MTRLLDSRINRRCFKCEGIEDCLHVIQDEENMEI